LFHSTIWRENERKNCKIKQQLKEDCKTIKINRFEVLMAADTIILTRRPVEWYIGTDLSEKPAASIFRIGKTGDSIPSKRSYLFTKLYGVPSYSTVILSKNAYTYTLN
jgi:hypothetical protein